MRPDVLMDGELTINGADFQLQIAPLIPQSLLLVMPEIIDGDDTYRPKIDLRWDNDRKVVTAEFEGPVDEAAQSLMQAFAEQFTQYLRDVGAVDAGTEGT
jgi:hypothetical protein